MRLLVISALAGHGHVVAANALEAWAKRVCPQAEVRIVDILDYTQVIYRKAYAASYLKLAEKAPELWGHFYTKGDLPVATTRQGANPKRPPPIQVSQSLLRHTPLSFLRA